MALAASGSTSIATDLRNLAASPRELWLIYVIKLLESVAYFCVYGLLVIYLSEDFSYSDKAAGSGVGIWLTAISLVVFVAGFIADSLGIRKALLIAAVSAAIGRTVLAFAPNDLVAWLGLALSVWGIACMKPTMNAAVRAYTSPQTVAFAFSFYYVVMNIGAASQAQISWFRSQFGHGTQLFGQHFSSSQLVFLVAATVSIVNVGLVSLLRDRPPEEGPAGVIKIATRSPIAIAKDVMREKPFWFFMLFIALLTLVRLVFQHAHITWPKYTLREFGKDFPYALYWSINPVMIIFLTPIATAITRRMPAYPVIVFGSVLSALSVFAMALSNTFAASITFIVILSIGEALWSPRLYEYTATVAPRGREASYMGMSEVPLFLAKPVVGFFSGWLLQTYCPEVGERDPQTLWLIVALTTIAAPAIMLVARRWLDRAPKGEMPA
ncbi:MAG: MFS transporter [Myxococcales bacterium]|nr:MFS transporter [Myxococcales bacterium]